MPDNETSITSIELQNNFNFLRLFFATCVIVTHAYPLSGLKECDILCQLTSGQIGFSYLGLAGFFSISGYLVTQSLINTESLLRYYWKRCIRIFPALLGCLIFTVILGCFIDESGVRSYIGNKTTWTYIPYNLSLYKIQKGMGNIFDNNPYPGVINGSIWTLSLEFTMYILISLLIWAKGTYLLKYLSFAGLFFFIVTDMFFQEKTISLNIFSMNIYWLLRLGVYFMVGAFLASINFYKFSDRKFIVTFFLTTLVITTYLNHFESFKFLLPPIVIYLGLLSTPIVSSIAKVVGDISYGVYLYAYPVQQTIYHYFSPNLVAFQIFSILISYFLGWLSWHLLEQRALKLKGIRLKF